MSLIKLAEKIAEAEKKKKPKGVATKTNPKLWERCKSEAKRKMGGKHSARAMQHALFLYKKRGGKFKGSKPTAKTNKMKKWTKQRWMYLKDFKSKKASLNEMIGLFEKLAACELEITKEAAEGRYLPYEKWKNLSPAQRKSTDDKKKREGKKKQYVENTDAAKVKSDKNYFPKKKSK